MIRELVNLSKFIIVIFNHFKEQENSYIDNHQNQTNNS